MTAMEGATVARPVASDAIRESIDLLMHSPIDYEFRTTVVKGMLNPENIEQIGREIRGAKTYVLQKFIPTKILNPQFKKKVSYSDEEFKQFQKMLTAYVDQCLIR